MWKSFVYMCHIAIEDDNNVDDDDVDAMVMMMMCNIK